MPRQNAIRDTSLPEHVSTSAFLPLFSNTTVYHDGRISQAGCLLEMGGHREKNATDREKRMWMTLLHFLFHSMTLFLFKLQTLDKEEHGKCSTFQILIFIQLSPIGIYPALVYTFKKTYCK